MSIEHTNGHGLLVPSVDRAAQILQAVASSETALGVSDLSRQLALNKSTTHAILNTLCRHQLLQRDDASKTYRLGQGLVELAQHVREQTDLRSVAHPRLVALARAVEETVLLGTYHDGHVAIIDKEESPHDLKITTPIGRRVHYSAAAFGKVFLAAMSESEVTQLLHDKPLRGYTAKSIVKPAAYRATLKQVRKRGYALDDEEYLAGVRAAGAPINDARGRVVAVLIVVGFGTRLPQDKLIDLALAVRRAAEEISRQLGATAYPTWNGVG
jgi:DNA-binding IclR family transcriptional regulator